MSQPEPEKSLRWTATGVAFFVIGLLILVPSGLCATSALLFFLGSLFSRVSQSEQLGITLFVMIVAAPFILLGIGFMRTGLKERRRRD
jgi:hypothetical protein